MDYKAFLCPFVQKDIPVFPVEMSQESFKVRATHFHSVLLL